MGARYRHWVGKNHVRNSLREQLVAIIADMPYRQARLNMAERAKAWQREQRILSYIRGALIGFPLGVLICALF